MVDCNLQILIHGWTSVRGLESPAITKQHNFNLYTYLSDLICDLYTIILHVQLWKLLHK